MAETHERSGSSRSAEIDESLQSILGGLSTIHELTIALDETGQICWLADTGELLGGVDRALIGQSAPSLHARFESAEGNGQIRIQASELVAMSADGTPASDRSPRPEMIDHPLELRRFDAVAPGGRPIQIIVGGRAASHDQPLMDPVLTRKHEELETCLHSVSHDLRSPLASVLGFTRLLRDEFGEPIGRTGQHFLDRIETAGRNMERLLRDMLELSKIDDAPHCPVRVNPLPVLEQLAGELKLSLDEAGIALEIPAEAPILVCDRTRLYQIFSNLVGNAVHHMETTTAGRIRVTIDEIEQGWEIAVEDNGPGIPPEDLDRVFRPFQTGSRPKKNRQSTGLGLAIVQKIVEAHEGAVRVESEVGSGTRFVIQLPQP